MEGNSGKQKWKRGGAYSDMSTTTPIHISNIKLIYFQLSLYAMVVDIMVPSHSVIRSHKKKIESSPSMIFPQGMVTTKVLPSAHTISNLQQ